MNAYRRSLLLVGILVSMSLFLVSCGDDDNGMEPPTPPPDPGLGWENPTPTGDAMRGIWGSASNNVYAVGNAGTLMRYNGTSWSLASQRLGEDVMWDVWGNTDTDIWAVGDNGAIWHYDGSWSESNSGTDKRLRGVFGLNANNVYAVGDDGTIVQWNGSG